MINLMINTNLNDNSIANNIKQQNKEMIPHILSSPKKYVEYYFYKNVISNKKKRKVNSDEFRILNLNEYDDILKFNYNVSQLKKMCKHYKYKVGGNKSELVKRLYNNMRLSFYAVKLQALFRKCIVKQMMALKNMHLLNKSTNDIDFLTLEPISSLKISQIICMSSEKQKHVFCFDICSLYNLFKEHNINKRNRKRTNTRILNPFNREPFPHGLFKKLYKIIRYTKMAGIHINIEIDNEDYSENLKKQNKFKAIDLFQIIDSFGFITDSKWFLNLNMYGLSKFMKELIDVWDYRAQLTSETSKKIFPPSLGYPFRINRNIFSGDIEGVRKTILKKISKFINAGVDRNSQSLAVFYVLGALTIVSKSAAENLPWLFESFTQL
jgi:hypothetical protein